MIEADTIQHKIICPLQRKTIVDRMTAAIIDRVKAKGECTDSDLRQAGFTDDDIRLCGSLAQGEAAAKLSDRTIS